MEISDLLRPQNVVAAARVNTKAKLLKELARRASLNTGLDERVIVDALDRREKLGSTGVGEGVAVPHARIKGLDRLFALFVRLPHAIDFAAVDGKPVDLVFLLLIPENAGAEHLAALACVSRRLRDKTVARSLRASSNPADLYRLLSGTP